MSTLHPCCEHCTDDPVHDVPTDQHNLPCITCEAADAYERGRRALRRHLDALSWEMCPQDGKRLRDALAGRGESDGR